MKNKIKFCNICKNYTLKDKHCDTVTIVKKPLKFSLEDKLGKYRRQLKEQTA